MTEVQRQLTAAREGRYRLNEHHRYIILGEGRPERKVREKLMRDRFIDWRWGPERRDGVVGLKITTEGEAALLVLEATHV